MEWMDESTEGGSQALTTTEILFTFVGKPLVETTMVGFLSVSLDQNRSRRPPLNRQIQSEELNRILRGLLRHFFGLHAL